MLFRSQVIDYGTNTPEKRVDYPYYCLRLAEAVSAKKIERGILACRSGIGMSICANKVKGVRAALCYKNKEAELSRRHNDANVLVLAGDFLSAQEAKAILRIWLKTKFDGGRHERRVKKIEAYEKKHCR